MTPAPDGVEFLVSGVSSGCASAQVVFQCCELSSGIRALMPDDRLAVRYLTMVG